LSLASLRKSSCHVRYVVACLFFLALVIAPIFTYLRLHGQFIDPGPINVPASWNDTAGILPTRPKVLPASTSLHPPEWMVRFFDPLLSMILLAWAIGAVAFLIRAAGGWFLVQRTLRLTAKPLRSQLETIVRIAGRFKLRRRVQFVESIMVQV